MALRPGLLCPQSPPPQADAERVVGLARALDPLRGTEGEPLEKPLDEALVRTVALSSAGSLSPMAAVLGAVAAQEVLKVGTGTGRVGLGGVQRSLWVPDSDPGGFTDLGAAPSLDLRGQDVESVPRLKRWPLGSLREVHAPGPVAVLRCP